jgi:hypothetical protein
LALLNERFCWALRAMQVGDDAFDVEGGGEDDEAL